MNDGLRSEIFVKLCGLRLKSRAIFVVSFMNLEKLSFDPKLDFSQFCLLENLSMKERMDFKGSGKISLKSIKQKRSPEWPIKICDCHLYQSLRASRFRLVTISSKYAVAKCNMKELEFFPIICNTTVCHRLQQIGCIV